MKEFTDLDELLDVTESLLEVCEDSLSFLTNHINEDGILYDTEYIIKQLKQVINKTKEEKC